MFFNAEEVDIYENDISAQKEIKIQGAWIQKENEQQGWKKGFSSQKIKRKKKIISLGHIICGLSSSIGGVG